MRTANAGSLDGRLAGGRHEQDEGHLRNEARRPAGPCRRRLGRTQEGWGKREVQISCRSIILYQRMKMALGRTLRIKNSLRRNSKAPRKGFNVDLSKEAGNETDTRDAKCKKN